MTASGSNRVARIIGWRRVVALGILLSLTGWSASAQPGPSPEDGRSGECLTGMGCSNFNANYPPGTFSSTSADWVTVDTCLYAGDYAYYSVTAGQSYEWSLCSADGGSAPYDSQLTLWSEDGTTRYCYSDDYCIADYDGKIAWTATFSGIVRLLVSEYLCADNNFCTTLVWRCASCSADMVVIADAWWSSAVDEDGDGCPRSARLNWNPDVADCSGTLTVFEKIYWKAGSSGTWTLVTTTSNHAVVNCNSDVWYVDYPFDSDCGPFDWKIELYRQGQPLPDYMRDPSNDSDLNDHAEERAADDVAQPPICVGDLNCDG